MTPPGGCASSASSTSGEWVSQWQRSCSTPRSSSTCCEAGPIERLRCLHRSHDDLYVSPINVEEVVRGLKPAEEQAATHLIAGLRIAPLRRREGWNAGEWRRALAATGRTVAQADALIAAAAHSLPATIATGNVKHFPTGQAPLADLVVEHWPTGE
jgi:predicted nucleic acid-binding protein